MYQVMNHNQIIGAFSEEDASRISGVSRAQLRDWDRRGFFEASYAAENRRSPYARIYSFRDLVALRVLGALRNDYGVSLQHLRKVAQKLEGLGSDKWTATTLYVLGKRVVFDDPQTNSRAEVVSGQRVCDIPLKVAAQRTREAIRDLNRRGDDELGKVVRSRFVQQNEPVLSGTRIPVSTIRHYLDAGASVQDILSEFPDLTEADILFVRERGDDAA